MKKHRKITSLLLAVAMVLTAFVATAFTASAAAVGSSVYFDNSKYNWENVYVYAYGTKNNAEWPGELMEKTDDGLYTKNFPSNYKSESIIFTNELEEAEGKEQ